MDERLTELLSRYLDDDLNAAERADFERMVETDSHLRSELDGTRRLRRSVASLASAMEPPAELNRVMEPLRQGPPAPKRHVRPVYRWLGAAAAVVLGITVTLEMARRNPSPAMVEPTRNVTANSDNREIFELAPLPSAVPEENRPVGATEHLLDEQPPPPPAPEPSALEVVGPLTTDEFSVANGRASAGPVKEHIDPETEVDSGGAVPPGTGAVLRRAEQPPSGAAATGKGGGDTPSDGDRDLSKSAPSPAGLESVGRFEHESDRPKSLAITRPTVVLVDSVVVWTGTTTSCDVGRWPVVLFLRHGVVIDLGIAGELGDDEGTGVCRPVDLVDTVLSGVADGRVEAVIVVEQPQ